MKEIDSYSELISVGDYFTPPEYRKTWTLWYCDWCDDFEYEFF